MVTIIGNGHSKLDKSDDCILHSTNTLEEYGSNYSPSSHG